MIADDLEIVGSYYFPYEADLARALLEAHDIPAWIVDELQVQQRWYIARALGGVKVVVARADAGKARELLAQDHSLELEETPESELPASPDESCPRCASPAGPVSRRLVRPRWFDLLLALVMSAPVRRTRTDFACSRCGHRWSRTGD